MHATQKRILDFLSQHPATSAAELARVLDVSAANIRHHLDIMKTAGLVEVVTRRAADGRGRPTNLYRLAAGAQQHNLAALTDHLLACALDELDHDGRETFLARLAGRMSATATHSSSRFLAQRLAAAVQFLSRHAYQARWEAHANAPRVILARCPYASILPAHPELCRLDAHLLAQLLAAPVAQLARIDLEQGKVPACIFSVGSTPAQLLSGTR